MIIELLILSVILIGWTFYKWATVNNDYFKRRNVKYMKPKFLFGNTGERFSKNHDALEYNNEMIYKAFPNEPYV